MRHGLDSYGLLMLKFNKLLKYQLKQCNQTVFYCSLVFYTKESFCMPLLCENLRASILSLVHNREEIYISLCFSCVKVFDQIIQ